MLELWIAIIALTVVASAYVLWRSRTVLRKIEDVEGENEFDIEVYRAQLSELKQEVRQGIISKADAESARAEIARRLIDKADTNGSNAAEKSPSRNQSRFVLAAVLFVLVPGVSLITYFGIGSPGLPAQPLAARMALQEQLQASRRVADQELTTLVERTREHLESNPSDGNGWAVVAPVAVQIGEIEFAIEAYENAIRLLPPDGARHAAIGEVLAIRARGEVTGDALMHFQRALTLEPANETANFFVGLSDAQNGRLQSARTRWEGVVQNASANSQWAMRASRGLAQLNQQMAADKEVSPEAAEIASLNEDEQQRAIRGMVQSLAERLETERTDAEGWKRLIRAYTVLDDPKSAADALNSAVEGLREQEQEAREVIEYAASLGVTVDAAN